jgi:hypothetical protein
MHLSTSMVGVRVIVLKYIHVVLSMGQVIEIVELVIDVECISHCKLCLLACTLCYLLKKKKNTSRVV